MASSVSKIVINGLIARKLRVSVVGGRSGGGGHFQGINLEVQYRRIFLKIF